MDIIFGRRRAREELRCRLERSLAKLLKLAGVKGSAHKFRHTFATELLQKGVSTEIVAKLLSHENIRITQKHYSHWIAERQAELEAAVQKTWKRDNMKKMRLRELGGWPPQPGGAHKPGARFPVAGESVVKELAALRDRTITFKGVFDGYAHSYHYTAESEKVALQIHSLVNESMGLTVAELGELQIEI